MPECTMLPQEDLEDLRYVVSLSEPRKPHTLDFSDPAQYRFYQRVAAGSGMTPERYPQYFKMMESAKDVHVQNGGPVLEDSASTSNDALVNVNAIADAVYSNPTAVGANATRTGCSASAFSSVVDGTIFTKLNLQVIDLSNGQQLVSQDTQTWGQGKYDTITAQGAAPSGTSGIRVIYTYNYQQPNQAPVFQTIHLDLDDEPLGIPTVSQPVLAATHTGNKYIKFGIGRDWQHTPVADCDYYWYETNQDNPTVRLPLVGSQKFRSRITSTITASDLTCYLMLAQKGGGGTPIMPTTDLLKGITISPSDPTLLCWNFPYNVDLTLDKSIQFGKATFSPDSQTVVLFQVRVKTANSGDDYVSTCIYGTTTGPWSPSTQDLPGVYAIRPFLYTWHCVSADTLIKLADGSNKRIDQLVGGDAVLANSQGDILKVTHTIFADKDEPIYSIRDEQDRNLLVTEKHGIMTCEGIRLAEELQVGDTLITESGESKIVSIELKPFCGRVWTIGLAPQSEEDLLDENRTFFANGILICDSEASFNRYVCYSRSLDAVLSRIPAEWHQDARNAYDDFNLAEV